MNADTMDPDSTPNLQALLRERYGAAAPTLDGPAHPALAALLSHRSVRHFAPRPLEAEALPLMLAAAQSASSSSNLQTWSVVAVEDAGRKDRLARLAGDQQQIRDCPLFMVWLADLARLETLGQQRGLPRAGLDYLELMLVGVIDATLAAQNAAVAAEAMGLGVVYIGAIRNQPEAVAEELGLPRLSFAVFGMCVGHPDPARPAATKPRLPPAAVLHRERYDPSTHLGPTETYVAVMSDFYRAQQMETRGDWVEHSLHRVRGPEALQGREHLVEALRRRGFEAR